MAKIAGKYLEDLYALCYLDPSSRHARHRSRDDGSHGACRGWQLGHKTDTSEEAQMALHLGHVLSVFEYLAWLQKARGGISDSGCTA